MPIGKPEPQQLLTQFQIKLYATEAVIFDSASGDTHYLAPLALTLFQLCSEFPGLHRKGLKTLLARHEMGSDLPPNIRFDETFNGLRKIGLINRE